MGLFKKIFSGDKQAQSEAGPSSQFHDSEDSTESPSRNAPRRELIHVVLRDTMRQHGIPSDWIDCRVLTDAGKNGRSVLHVQLIVRHGHDRLLTYVPAFQGSFMQCVEKFDPRYKDWLSSLAWQFEGLGTSGKFPSMPDPESWTGDSAPLPLTATGIAATGLTAAKVAQEEDDDVSQDIKALFAIRDEAMRQPPPGHVDFQPTQPGA